MMWTCFISFLPQGGKLCQHAQFDGAGRAHPLHRIQTRIRRDTQKFEFHRFRFEYFYSKQFPSEIPQLQISATLSTIYRDSPPVEDPPLPENERKIRKMSVTVGPTSGPSLPTTLSIISSPEPTPGLCRRRRRRPSRDLPSGMTEPLPATSAWFLRA